MTAQQGSLVLLKVGNGGSPEIFTTIGGLQITGFSHHNKGIDVTTKDSNGWRELLDEGGVSSVAISGNGIFTDSTAEATVRDHAMSNRLKNYQINFGNGDL